MVPQVRIAKQLTLGRTVDPKDVAILTPYNAQAAEISKSLGREGVTGVTVCSVTKSQGERGSGAGGSGPGGHKGGCRWHGRASARLPNRAGSEWRYVLVSTVRTCPESDLDQRPTKSWLKKFLGFVVDPNQVNVAITRAKEGLCLIGRAAPPGVRGWGGGFLPGVWLLGGGWGIPWTPLPPPQTLQETTASCVVALSGGGSWTSVRTSGPSCPPARCEFGGGQQCLPEQPTLPAHCPGAARAPRAARRSPEPFSVGCLVRPHSAEPTCLQWALLATPPT